MSVSGQGYEDDSFSPWFLQEETITLSLNEAITNDDENLVDTSMLSSWWFISLTVSSLLILVFLSYKILNKEDSYSINLDDDDDDEQIYDHDDEIEDTPFTDIGDIESSIVPEKIISEKSPRRTRSRAVRTERDPLPVTTTRKRRTRATDEDSSVKVSKRRRLVENEVEPKVRKRRAIRQSTEVEDVEMSDDLNRYEGN